MLLADDGALDPPRDDPPPPGGAPAGGALACAPLPPRSSAANPREGNAGTFSKIFPKSADTPARPACALVAAAVATATVFGNGNPAPHAAIAVGVAALLGGGVGSFCPGAFSGSFAPGIVKRATFA